MLINLGTTVFQADLFYEFLLAFQKSRAPLEILNDANFKQVLFEIKLVKVICIMNLIFAITAAFGFIMAPEYFDQKAYLSVWIPEHFSHPYDTLLILILHWSSIPVAHVMVGISILWTYAVSYAIFSIRYLKEMIESISDTTIPEKMRYDSKLYQEMVRQRMLICIMSHAGAKR